MKCQCIKCPSFENHITFGEPNEHKPSLLNPNLNNFSKKLWLKSNYFQYVQLCLLYQYQENDSGPGSQIRKKES